MAKTAVKEIHVNFPNKNYLQSFIETISNALKHVEFTLNYRQGGLKIRITGEKDVVFESAHLVKSLSSMFVRSTTPNNEGYYSHHLQLIQQVGSKIISLDSLSSVLQNSGISTSVVGQELVTKANMKEVQKVLSDLFVLMQELPLNVRSQTMKTIILTASYCTNYSPDFIIDQGFKYECFREQSGSIVINMAPEKCVEYLLQKLSDENTKQEYNKFTEEDWSIRQRYFKE
ncbi:MAG: DUF2067 family protein [Candidatus Thorarchaeota archaeon]